MMFFRRIWHLLNRRRHERELVQEMHQHRAAMHDPSSFGDTHRLLERSRDAWGWNWLDDALQDLGVGVRTLLRSPVFAVTATLMLAFGIGLNVTLYQVIQAALLRPPAIPEPASWVRFHRGMKNGSSTSVPYPVTQFVKSNNDVLKTVVVEASDDIAWGRDAAIEIEGSFVSPNWFDELGYGPLHGRVFSEALDATADVPSVVIGFGFWRDRLGSDPNVVGTTVYLARQPATVVGVAPLELPGLDFDSPDVFVPVTQRDYFYPGSPFLRAWDIDTVAMYGRLKDGVTPAVARDALRGVMAALAAERRDVEPGNWLEPLPATHNFMRPSEYNEVLTLLALIATLSGMVLIVAAANLGNLVMSRSAARVRELGIRMALGARRGRIVRQLVVESVPLVLLGAAGSLAFSATAATLITSTTGFPPYIDFSIEWRTVAAALILAGLALLVVGLLPAWKVAQQHLINAVKDGGQQVSQTIDRALLRRAMVTVQVAGTCVLLIVSGMMVRSVQRAMSRGLGFDYATVAVLEVPLERYGVSREASRGYWEAVKERALAHPEVEQAAIVTAAPFGGRRFETLYDDLGGLSVLSQSVDPEYFETMRIPLVRGRVFGAGDTGTLVVSRRLALEMYGTLDVLGQRFPKRGERIEGTIIGVAGDAHAIKLNATNVAELYRPLALADFGYVELLARARTDVDLLPAVLREAAMHDPRAIPVARPLSHDFDRRLSGPRTAGAIAGGVGMLTLLLACLGIFGVVSYGVALRTKEIGIRVALGASRAALLTSIVRQVLTPVGVGVGAGVLIALPVAYALSGDPFYLEQGDPVAFGGALAAFVAAGAIAALWPAARALQGNPVEALRHS